MKRLMFVSTAMIMSSSILAETIDYVECKRNRSSFRQFCSVNEAVTEKKITVDRHVELNGEILDLKAVYQTGSISVEGLNGNQDRVLTFTGLTPFVKADIDWTQSRECSVSDLWWDKIYLSVQDPDTGNDVRIDKLKHGLNSYDKNLEVLRVNGFKPWVVSDTSSGSVDIATRVFIHNEDHSDSRPLAYQRLPTYCKMNVHSMRIGFDPLQISRDLDVLEIQADTTISLKARTEVLHANYMDSRRGAICSVQSIGNKLKDIEFAWEFEDLSDDSRDLISDGIQQAVLLNAISSSDIPVEFGEPNYFSYFIGNKFQNQANEMCGSVSDSIYIVSVNEFMEGNTIVNHQGYNNARIHEKATANLREQVKAAWAINNIAKEEVANYEQKEWLTSPIITSQF